MKRLVNTTLAPLTIDAAKQSASFYCPMGQSAAVVVIASAASTPVGMTFQFQGSLDNINFVNLDSAVTVVANGVFAQALLPSSCSYLFYRVSYLRSSGSYIATTSILIKGEEE